MSHNTFRFVCLFIIIFFLATTVSCGPAQHDQHNAAIPETVARAADESGAIPVASKNDAFPLEGTIIHSELEGGAFLIEGDNGTLYAPINLPALMQQPGLKISALAIRKTEMAGIHMMGESIELHDVRIRP